MALRLRAKRCIDKLAVSGTEPGLTQTQLMLINEDLKPGEFPEDGPHCMCRERRVLIQMVVSSRTRTAPMECMELCRILDCGLFQHRGSSLIGEWVWT